MKYVRELLGSLGSEVEMFGLEDGGRVAPMESVMHLVGPVDRLLTFETVYLGLLARMTRIATNVREAVDAARGKPVLFFPARFDIPEAQPYDGYAAKVGGAFGASTQGEAEAFGTSAVGTMPHALIAAFKGDTVAAALAFADVLPDEPLWALVDFENDSARTAVEVFRALRERGGKLAGVRLDTSQGLVDRSLQRIRQQNAAETAGETPALLELQGVQPELAFEVRRRLNEAGAHDVKISVSGGFSAEKIRMFEERKAPVDVYAIGERFLRGSTPFTSDVVGYYEGDAFVPCAKIGREFRPNARLKRIALGER
jgi:nicotinate phosphoribosyltransferase